MYFKINLLPSPPSSKNWNVTRRDGFIYDPGKCNPFCQSIKRPDRFNSFLKILEVMEKNTCGILIVNIKIEEIYLTISFTRIKAYIFILFFSSYNI